ncbi:hypothetical protein MPSEU_000757500 [Mayamaea pseudoterrestris]|nr:hypothetical protein MPSEU_000757500 [Mayamaea pseudoterrestris]
MNNRTDSLSNDSLGAQSVHVANEITITRRQHDVAPKKPRRIYDSPPTIALRRGFSYDAIPNMPMRSLLEEVRRTQASSYTKEVAFIPTSSHTKLGIETMIPSKTIVKTRSKLVTANRMYAEEAGASSKTNILPGSIPSAVTPSLASCIRKAFIARAEAARGASTGS